MAEREVIVKLGVDTKRDADEGMKRLTSATKQADTAVNNLKRDTKSAFAGGKSEVDRYIAAVEKATGATRKLNSAQAAPRPGPAPGGGGIGGLGGAAANIGAIAAGGVGGLAAVVGTIQGVVGALQTVGTTAKDFAVSLGIAKDEVAEHAKAVEKAAALQRDINLGLQGAGVIKGREDVRAGARAEQFALEAQIDPDAARKRQAGRLERDIAGTQTVIADLRKQLRGPLREGERVGAETQLADELNRLVELQKQQLEIAKQEREKIRETRQGNIEALRRSEAEARARLERARQAGEGVDIAQRSLVRIQNEIKAELHLEANEVAKKTAEVIEPLIRKITANIELRANQELRKRAIQQDAQLRAVPPPAPQ